MKKVIIYFLSMLMFTIGTICVGYYYDISTKYGSIRFLALLVLSIIFMYHPTLEYWKSKFEKWLK